MFFPLVIGIAGGLATGAVLSQSVPSLDITGEDIERGRQALAGVEKMEGQLEDAWETLERIQHALDMPARLKRKALDVISGFPTFVQAFVANVIDLEAMGAITASERRRILHQQGMTEAAVLYQMLLDPGVGTHHKSVIITALSNFMDGDDLIPDSEVGGFMDDVGAIHSAWNATSEARTRRHYKMAGAMITDYVPAAGDLLSRLR